MVFEPHPALYILANNRCNGLINQDTSKDHIYNVIRGEYEQ